MYDKETLFELNETFLANREDMDGKYLTFWLEDQLYGIPVSKVVHITGMHEIFEISDYPAYVIGAMNLQGIMIPLIEVRIRLGKTKKAYDANTCVIVAMIHSEYFGFIVDKVNEITDLCNASILPPPQRGVDLSICYLTGFARLKEKYEADEKVILCLDTTKLLGNLDQPPLLLP